MILTLLQEKILKQKGFNLKNKKEIEKFLWPDWDRDLLDSSKIKDIEKAVERIKKAIDENEKIVIFADYDSDGIPGAVILHDLFEKINYKNFSVYIPHRHNEGYGLNKNAIQKFIDEGVKLIITVDVSITNLEEIKFAEENNINVIVTDHHLPIQSPPDLTRALPQDSLFPQYSEVSSKTFLSPQPPEGGLSTQDGFCDKELFAWTGTNKNKYKELKKLALEFRQNKTEAEEKLWKNISGNKLGCHFRQQHIINNFIVDFVCLEKRLILEIDGKMHDYQKESDKERQEILESFGFKILRIKNEDVLENINLVLEKIKDTLEKLDSREVVPPSGARGTEKGFQTLPPAFAIVNTKQEDDKYEEKFLCGAATAWKLVNAFLNKYRNDFNVIEGWEKWLLDMVGISTIADLVPLRGENRLLAKYGLEVLKKTRRPGLLKIFSNARILQKKINEDDIAFGIAPRLNAASRMAEPIHAFYALLQNEESVNYANELENYNEARKQEAKDAETIIDYEKISEEKIVLIGDESWTPGIIGLVASRVCETVKKTTFVWGVGEDENILKGSVRAGEDGYNVVEIMTSCQYLFENFGGHEMAGGFAIHKNNLEKFQKFLREYALTSHPTPEIEIKKEEKGEVRDKTKLSIKVDIKDLNRNTWDEIKIFAPFGVENEKIIFKIKRKKEHFIQSKRFGKNKEHLEISINGVRGIEFFVSEEREKELLSQKEFFVNLEWDNFRGDVVMRFIK